MRPSTHILEVMTHKLPYIQRYFSISAKLLSYNNITRVTAEATAAKGGNRKQMDSGKARMRLTYLAMSLWETDWYQKGKKLRAT